MAAGAGGQPSPEGKAVDVVISDDREDGVREFSRKLKNDLQLSGVSASLDDDTPSIESCQAFIPILTKKYVHTRYCVGQLYVACREEKDLLPVVYEDGWDEGEEGARVFSIVAHHRQKVYFRPDKDDYQESLGMLVHNAKSVGYSQCTSGKKQATCKYKKISFKDLEFDYDSDSAQFFERGKFGDVRKARWKGKIVAVKCFSSADRLGGFSEELVCLTLLQSHRHIVKFYGACVSDRPFIVLEFAPLTLEKVIHGKFKVSGDSAVPSPYHYYADHVMNWSHHLSLALEYIHRNRFIYRDVKSSNCLLFESGRLLKLCDFGTATKEKHTLTNAVGTVGAVMYMAPEVIRGRYYTTSCDVFSFGIIMWEMIARKRPFITGSKGNNMAILYAIANGKRPPMISYIPRALKEMIYKCWDTDPGMRPTMTEIRGKLEILCMYMDVSRPLAKKNPLAKPVNTPDLLSEVDANAALLTATESGDVVSMRRLLEIGYLRENNQVSVLMSASKSGHADCVKLLLEYGIDVNILNENGQSALMIACKHGHSDVVQILLNHGAQTNLQDKDGVSPLMIASEAGNFEIAKQLLKHGTSVGLQNSNGWTAVMLASYNNHVKVVETLLKCGGKVEKEFLVQLSPSRHAKVLELLQNQLDSDEIEQKHLAAVEQAISTQGSLTHTTVHGVIVGLARSGKDSLMKRLLGEMLTGKSPSTGVAENAIHVRVEKSSYNTVSACVEDTKWIRLTLYDDEAIDMMTKLTSKQKSTKAIKKQPRKFGFSESREKTNEGMVDESSREFTPNPKHIEQSKALVHTPKDVGRPNYRPVPKPRRKIPPANTKSPLEIFKTALRTKKLQGLRQHLENNWSIYLSNTGGQMEFQELLPLLVSGPSMFFVTFRLDRDLNQRYQIEYEVHDSEKIFKYTSSATPLETILQTLASIDAVGTYDYSQKQREKSALTYKVFIVGTHRDILEQTIVDKQAVQQKIKEIDRVIFESVQLASYFHHIRFASMDQLIFTVNNFSKCDDDFQHIRSSVQQVVDTGDFVATSPSHWLIYSLVLRQLKNQIESYSKCFKIARDCGISDDDEHKEALHFIHTKMGIIRYFPIDELKLMIFLTPQVLFDGVTEVIVETFSFEHAGYHSAHDFKKGIFKFSDLEAITHRRNPGSLLTSTCLTRLLKHLRIAAEFYEDGVLKIFFPCALSHACDSNLQEQPSQASFIPIPPLVISFQCGYRPMGVAGALIAYLMNEGQTKELEWILLPDEIYRDQVSFCVEPSCDTIVLKMLPTHMEVRCLPESVEDRDDYPVQKTCTEVCKSIKAGIEKVNSDINYINNAEPIFTFYCQNANCGSKAHPAKIVYSHDNVPRRLSCPRTKKPHRLPTGYENWKLQELFTCTTADDKSIRLPSVSSVKPLTAPSDTNLTRCDSTNHVILLTQLNIHAAKWREIGTHLGFLQGEMDNIQSSPMNLAGAPLSYLNAMLALWLEWAPGDARGSTQYATLEALKRAISEAGLGSTADSLKLTTP